MSKKIDLLNNVSINNNLEESMQNKNNNNSTVINNNEEEMTMKKLSSQEVQLKLEASKLLWAQCNYDKFDGYSVSEVESLHTDEEEGTVLGFSIQDAEDARKEAEFEFDLALSQQYAVRHADRLNKKYGMDVSKLNDQILVELVKQDADYLRETGFAPYAPFVKITFQKYYEKFDVWGGISKGKYGFNFKGQKQRVMDTKVNEESGLVEVTTKLNAHFLIRDIEDVFVLNKLGMPIALKEVEQEVPCLVQDANGKFQKTTAKKSMNIISAYARALGIVLDGKTHRVIIECESIGLLIDELGSSEDTVEAKNAIENADMVTLERGILIKRPNRDLSRDELESREAQSEIQYDTSASVSGYVATAKGLWEEKKAMEREEALSTKYAQRKADGIVATEKRKDAWAEKVLAENAEYANLYKTILLADVEDALDMVNEIENPRLMISVARAFRRLHDVELDETVYKALAALKRDAVKEKVSAALEAINPLDEGKELNVNDMIRCLNDSNTRDVTLKSMYGNIELIEEVLRVAERNLADYKSDKETIANVKRQDYNLVDFQVFKLLDSVRKNHAKIA